MRYCARCLYPENHPLHLTFDDEGVCSGCRIHEEKDKLDWAERRDRLSRLLDSYRQRSGANYDCVVPVSGARNSYFITDVIRREFGLNPLLVTYNTHYTTPRGHRNLAYLRTSFDVDCYTMLLGADLLRQVTERTLELLGSMYWHCLAGQTVLPAKVAVQYKIPLIVWGAHQGLDQVGMFSHCDETEMTRKYRKDHDLMGLEAEDLVNEAAGLPERDLRPFFYPNDKDLEAVGVRGIYLGNFIRWDSKAQHESMIGRYGYETGRQQRTFDTYNDVDCAHYSGLHDYIKLMKHGYGKATDHACREIRLKRLTRDQAIELVRCYQDVPPTDAAMFCEWLGISEDALWQVLERHRNPDLWNKDMAGTWRLQTSVVDAPAPTNQVSESLPVTDLCQFRLTPSLQSGIAEDQPSILERGYVDSHPAPDYREVRL